MRPLPDADLQDRASVRIRLGGEAVILDGRGVAYLPERSVLIVADLHLEKGSRLGRRSAPIPPLDTLDTLLRLETCMGTYAPETVVCLGDSFHDGAALARIDARDRLRLDRLCARPRRWVWISGNHDPAPGGELPGEPVAHLAIGPLTLKHIPDATRAQPQIAGHFHPKTLLRAHGVKIAGRCFLAGRDLLILPAFGAYTGGLSCTTATLRDLFAPEKPSTFMLFKDKIWAVT